MTVQQILDIPMTASKLESMAVNNPKLLRSMASTLASAANKRINRLEKSGIQSPALSAFYDASATPRFTIKGVENASLVSLIKTMKEFMNRETSTVKGAKKWQEKSIEELRKATGVEFNNTNFAEFWKAYNQLKQLDASVSAKSLKYSLLKKIDEYMVKHPDAKASDIVGAMMNEVGNIYEEMQRERSERASTSSFFDI